MGKALMLRKRKRKMISREFLAGISWGFNANVFKHVI
jgi:hypothetical protein